MAKINKQDLKEKNDLVEAFGLGLKAKAPIAKPGKGRKLNKQIDSISDLRNEFLLNRQGKGDTDGTLRAYNTQLNRLQDFIGFYIASDTEKEEIKGSFYDYVDSYRQHMRTLGGKAPIRILETPNLIAFFKDFLLKQYGLSEHTVISCLRHVRAFIYYAQENKWIERFDIKIKTKALPIKSTFTDDELQRLLKKPKNQNDYVAMRNWMMIKYLTAVPNRIGSMLALKVEDVDFENNIVRVNNQKADNPATYRIIKIRHDLMKFINDFHTDEEGNINYDEFLFSNQYGDSLSYSSCTQAMKRYFEERNIPYNGFHKFRYTYAQRWIADEGDPFTLKEQLGHSSLAMTNHYAQAFGVSHNDEIDKHSLISQLTIKSGRKKKKKRGS